MLLGHINFMKLSVSEYVSLNCVPLVGETFKPNQRDGICSFVKKTIYESGRLVD